MSQSDDERWMKRALELAERGRGFVEPNPLVGAVIVRDGAVVGEGWHERFGGPHAEINAFAAAGNRAAGGTLFVSLEPCCHHGKTPPCTDAITKAGIRRVVAAMGDPFPDVSGQGFAALQAAGIDMQSGWLAAEAELLNAPYLTLLSRKRPYVHTKWAMSLDGRIATRTGESKWITGRAARQRGHELRGRMDAIIVGAGTVRADNPRLTARPPGPRTPTRIVLSTDGALSNDCQVFSTNGEGPVALAVPEDCSATMPVGVERIALPALDGRPSAAALLAELGRRRMTNVLVEGGAETLGSFFSAGLMDEVHVFIAPVVIGGEAARGPVGGAGIDDLMSAYRFDRAGFETIGDDLYWHGRRAHNPSQQPAQ